MLALKCQEYKMKNWFLQKNDSEQKVIVILMIFIFLLMLYAFLYLPIKRNNTQLQSSISDIQTEIIMMRNLETKISRFENNPNIKKETLDDSQLMALIEQLAKQQEISLSNIKSQGKNKISVTLNNVSFNTAVRWLDVLQTQHHIGISQLIVETLKKGLTNITVIISH